MRSHVLITLISLYLSSCPIFLDKKILAYLQRALEGLIKVDDDYEFAPGISVVHMDVESGEVNRQARRLTGDEEPENYILHRIEGYLNTHVLNVNLARALEGWQTAIGVSSNQEISCIKI
ncbi:hypothetical protein B566_EDAN009213 [Ephemera danica]|nr:hypothetical protein B566_EDAN009213 [Ephemera danica]